MNDATKSGSFDNAEFPVFRSATIPTPDLREAIVENSMKVSHATAVFFVSTGPNKNARDYSTCTPDFYPGANINRQHKQ